MVLVISPPANAACARAGPPARKATHGRPPKLIDPPRSARSPALLTGFAPLFAVRSRAPGRHAGAFLRHVERKDHVNAKDIEEDQRRHREDGGSSGTVWRSRQHGGCGCSCKRRGGFHPAQQTQEVAAQCAEKPRTARRNGSAPRWSKGLKSFIVEAVNQIVVVDSFGENAGRETAMSTGGHTLGSQL
jgi:hypothetical protein